MKRLTLRERRNQRRRRPRPMIHWQHLLGMTLVVVPFVLWFHQVHRDVMCDHAVTMQECR